MTKWFIKLPQQQKKTCLICQSNIFKMFLSSHQWHLQQNQLVNMLMLKLEASSCAGSNFILIFADACVKYIGGLKGCREHSSNQIWFNCRKNRSAWCLSSLSFKILTSQIHIWELSIHFTSLFKSLVNFLIFVNYSNQKSLSFFSSICRFGKEKHISISLCTCVFFFTFQKQIMDFSPTLLWKLPKKINIVFL